VDWSNLAYFAFIAAFVVLMMRSCGGGMCGGMGRRRLHDPHVPDRHRGDSQGTTT